MSMSSDFVAERMTGGGHEPFGDHAKAKPKRDLKKLALIVGLSVLAWVSTYTGMLELIQANLGEVGIVEKVATGLAVVMLQIMIVWLLDQMFSPIHASVKAFYIVGYLFLTLISVGFAFGFYWKVLESRSATTSSAETSIGSVQSALRGAETRLDQLVSTLEQLTAISTQKADQEAANGNSCPGSKPGAGPRMAMRKGDAEKFSFASTFVKGRSEQVKGDIKTLDVDLQRILKDDKGIVDAKTGTRNEFLKGMSRKLEETTARYNALRTDAQLRQIRTDAAERAEKTTFPDSRGGTYACPDGQLQSALRGVVAAIDQLPALEKPKIAATEGSEAVIEAFRRLTTTLFGALQFKMPPTPEEIREKQAKAVQAMESPAAALAAQKAVNMETAGLGKRDYIPLGIAIFVDFCLLMVSFGRPANRFARTAMELKAAELGPQSAIVGINREVHEDPIVRRNFEQLQHVVIHFGNHYLAAVPLTAPRLAADGHELSPQEREKLQVEAQTLVTLFSGLELNNAIVDRGLPPFLLLLGGARLVRRRLLKQESKFARAGAFRFYRFRNRAWPEMILGTVMGTAKKYQQELAQRRAEEAAHEQEMRQLEKQRRAAELAAQSASLAAQTAIHRRNEAASKRQMVELQHSPPVSAFPRPLMEPAPGYSPAHDPALRATGRASHGAFAQQASPSHGPGHGLAPAGHMRAEPSYIPQGPANPPRPVPGMPHLVEPANHNTAPADRPRQPGFAAPSSAFESRPLPHNVVPLPDRADRWAPAEASVPPHAAAIEQGSFPAPSLQPAPVVEASRAISVEANGDSGAPTMAAADLKDVLRTVAVTSFRVAQDVAAAVHRMDEATTAGPATHDRGGPQRMIDAGEFGMTAAGPARDIVGAAHAFPGLPANLPAVLTGVATPVPSLQASPAQHDAVVPRLDADRSVYAGRGLAADPGLDDAGSIALRYAPQPTSPR